VTYYGDADKDGYGSGESTKCLCAPVVPFIALQAGDCDDSDAGSYPGYQEICGDKKDNDCNGQTDEAGCMGCITFFRDADADGWGLDGDSSCLSAPAKPYTATSVGDCDDGDFNVHPGATEICNAKDDNCDGITDPSGSQGCDNYFADQDSDGWGSLASLCLCGPKPGYKTQKSGDCNDNDQSVYPGAVETCNGKDDDCDGLTDPDGATGCQWLYRDGDGDEFGLDSDRKCACQASGKYTAIKGGDCDDADPDVHPGASICGKDADCDGAPADPGEECDDGLGTAWDGCSACKVVEFQVNTWTTGTQVLPAVATLAGGGYFVAWSANDPGAGGTTGWDVKGQRFRPDGTRDGGEMLVTGFQQSGDQVLPAVTSLGKDGLGRDRFVVEWTTGCSLDGNCGSTSSSADVYMRAFDGLNWSGSQMVNSYTTDGQATPSVSGTADGSFVSVWTSQKQEGATKGWGIYGRRHSLTVQASAEFHANVFEAGNQSQPVVAVFGEGADSRFVVAWTTECLLEPCSTSISRVRFRVFDLADLSAKTMDKSPETNALGTYQSRPSLARLDDGGFVLAWLSATAKSGASDVYARRFNKDGKPRDKYDVRIANGDAALGSLIPLPPGVAVTPEGRILVTWTASLSANTDVHGAWLDPPETGQMQAPGTVATVSTYTNGQQYGAAPACEPGGTYCVIAWSSGCLANSGCAAETSTQDGSGPGVFAQRFTTAGVRIYP
jgi:hypothetical protein